LQSVTEASKEVLCMFTLNPIPSSATAELYYDTRSARSGLLDGKD